MRLQDGTLYFNLPPFLSSPIMLFFIGLLLGVAIMFVIRQFSESKKHPSSFANKAASLGNIKPAQIISRTKAVIGMAQSMYKLKDLPYTYKPTNNDSLQKYTTHVNRGIRIVLNDSVDFYEFIGNWEKLRVSVSKNIKDLENVVLSNGLNSEEMRKDARQEITRIKEHINKNVI